MKRDNLAFITLVTLLLCNACLSPSNKQEMEAENVVSIDIKQATSLDFKEYFDTINYIPLETNDDALIGEITKLYYTENGFLIFDQKTMGIFLFSTDGHFIRKIGRKGEGPDEYLFINDIQYDAERQVIYVHERYRNSIYTYDCMGNLLEKTSPAVLSFNSFFRTKDGCWVYSCFKKNNPECYNLTLLSSDLQTVRKHYFPQKDFINITFSPTFTGDTDGRVFFYYPSSNVIYELDGTDAVPYLRVDFGDHTIPYDKIVEMENMEECDRLLASHTYLGNIDRCFVCQDHVYFSFSETGTGIKRGYKCFYDTISGKGYVFNAPFMSSAPYPISSNLLYASGSMLVYPIYPALFSENSFEKLSQSFSSNIDFDSNLILAVCHLKSF